MAKNLYETLGVNKDASPDEIKKAYRAMAIRYHPDKNPGDEEAAKMFREADDAYTILKDPEARLRYDLGKDQTLEDRLPDMTHFEYFDTYHHINNLSAQFKAQYGTDHPLLKQMQDVLDSQEAKDLICEKRQFALYGDDESKRLVTPTRYEINNLTELRSIIADNADGSISEDEKIADPDVGQILGFAKKIDAPDFFYKLNEYLVSVKDKNVTREEFDSAMLNELDKVIWYNKQELLNNCYVRNFGVGTVDEIEKKLNEDSSKAIDVVRSDAVLNYISSNLDSDGKFDFDLHENALAKLYAGLKQTREDGLIDAQTNLERTKHDVLNKYDTLRKSSDAEIISALESKGDKYLLSRMRMDVEKLSIEESKYDYFVDRTVGASVKSDADLVDLIKGYNKERRRKDRVLIEIPQDWKKYIKKGLEIALTTKHVVGSCIPPAVGITAGLMTLGATDSYTLTAVAYTIGHNIKQIPKFGKFAFQKIVKKNKDAKFNDVKDLEESIIETNQSVDNVLDDINNKGGIGSAAAKKIKEMVSNRARWSYVPHAIVKTAPLVALTVGAYNLGVHDWPSDLAETYINFVDSKVVSAATGLSSSGVKTFKTMYDGLGPVADFAVNYASAGLTYGLASFLLGLVGVDTKGFTQKWEKSIMKSDIKRSEKRSSDRLDKLEKMMEANKSA